jgi:hypothetical protein
MHKLVHTPDTKDADPRWRVSHGNIQATAGKTGAESPGTQFQFLDLFFRDTDGLGQKVGSSKYGLLCSFSRSQNKLRGIHWSQQMSSEPHKGHVF